MKSILILILIFTTACTAQTQYKSIPNEIVDLYISKHEIEKGNKQRILDHFKEIIQITDLIGINDFKSLKVGVYKISPNISHTTTSLLILNKENYSILAMDDNFINSFNQLSTFLKKNNSITKSDTIKYFESFFKIIQENKTIIKNSTLEDINN